MRHDLKTLLAWSVGTVLAVAAVVVVIAWLEPGGTESTNSLVILAAFLGGIVTPVVTKLVDDWMMRSRRREEERDRFQWETLIEVQDAIYELRSSISDLHFAISNMEPKHPLNVMVDDMEAIRDQLRRITVLRSRVFDSDIRYQLGEYCVLSQSLWSSSINEVGKADDPSPEYAATQTRLDDKVIPGLHESIGRILREDL